MRWSVGPPLGSVRDKLSSVHPQVADIDAERPAAFGAGSEHPSEKVVRVARAVQMPIVHSLLMVPVTRGDDVRRVVAPASRAEDDVMTV